MEKANSRLHAMTAFALSEIYQKANNLELMEHYLLVAAISDITSATKENVAPLFTNTVHTFTHRSPRKQTQGSESIRHRILSRPQKICKRVLRSDSVGPEHRSAAAGGKASDL